MIGGCTIFSDHRGDLDHRDLLEVRGDDLDPLERTIRIKHQMLGHLLGGDGASR